MPMLARPKGRIALCKRCFLPEWDSIYLVGHAADHLPCARCSALGITLVDERTELPRGSGTVLSTSLALDIPGRVRWDVNGYYRALGVSPYADRAEIRRGYIDSRGQDSHRLTYYVRQLLNREVRAAYDACPPWTVFVDEFWRDSELVRQAVEKAVEDSQENPPCSWNEGDPSGFTGMSEEPVASVQAGWRWFTSSPPPYEWGSRIAVALHERGASGVRIALGSLPSGHAPRIIPVSREAVGVFLPLGEDALGDERADGLMQQIIDTSQTLRVRVP